MITTEQVLPSTPTKTTPFQYQHYPGINLQSPSKNINLSNIQVVCRFRPLNKQELALGGKSLISFDKDYTAVKINNFDTNANSMISCSSPTTSHAHGNHEDSSSFINDKSPFLSSPRPGTPLNPIQQSSTLFKYDRIFSEDHDQDQVFKFSAQNIVDAVMDGYNGTILAYGQTGSGKTYTMMGNIECNHNKGIAPRIVERIFENIVNSSSDIEFTVKVSNFEIYMEKVRCLLNPSNDNLGVHEDRAKGVYVKGLLEVFVSSVQDVYKLMEQGHSTRAVGSTTMNAESSRSHAIFQIHITQKSTLTGTTKTGKLSLVDLAGSERQSKTGTTGQVFQEATKINKSLSALGNVINALTEKSGKLNHIPYRDSKLTRILQESLGGNARTTLIVNCSPSPANESETISTLRFGVRAKSIKNNAKINTELSPLELKLQLKNSKLYILQLESALEKSTSELNIWRSGKTVKKTDWVANIHPLSNHDRDTRSPIPESSQIVDDLQEKISNLEGDLENAKNELLAAAGVEKGLKESLVRISDLEHQVEKAAFEVAEGDISLDALEKRNIVLHEELQSKQTDCEIALKTMIDLKNTCQRLQTRQSEMESEIKERNLQIVHLSTALEGRGEECSITTARLEHVEKTLHQVQQEYQHLIDQSILNDESQDVTTRQEPISAAREIFDRQTTEYEQRIAFLEGMVKHKDQEIVDFKVLLQDHVALNTTLKKEFKAVLEQSRLEATRDSERYTPESPNSKGSGSKLAFLQSSMDQLSIVQKQLVAQNSHLKNECSLLTRKLSNRSDRIQRVEELLREAQTSMAEQESRHEQIVSALEDKLQQAKAETNSFSSSQWIHSSKIVKPLRGGGSSAPAAEPSSIPPDNSNGLTAESKIRKFIATSIEGLTYSLINSVFT